MPGYNDNPGDEQERENFRLDPRGSRLLAEYARSTGLTGLRRHVAGLRLDRTAQPRDQHERRRPFGDMT